MEKRSEPRYLWGTGVELKTSQGVLEGLLLDVSPGGALVVLDSQEDLDFTDLGASVKLKAQTQEVPFLKTQGTIIRIEEMPQSLRIGIQFQPTDWFNQDFLQKELKTPL